MLLYLKETMLPVPPHYSLWPVRHTIHCDGYATLFIVTGTPHYSLWRVRRTIHCDGYATMNDNKQLKPLIINNKKMFIIIVFWLGCDRPSELLFFVPTLLLFILTPLLLPSSSVSLSYFVLAVPMLECLGKHSCMSSPCPIPSFFREATSAWAEAASIKI